jgi:hypothetical protein
MATNVTRGQHYVWRHYLEAWETGGQLFASRNRSAPFSSAAKNIGKQRDFYKLPRLYPNDVAYIYATIERMKLAPEAHEAALGWLEPWYAVLRIEQQFLGIDMPKPVRSALTTFEIQVEERFHSKMEDEAVPMLRALRLGDASFWSRDANAASFSFFISIQHLRTKRLAERLPEGIEDVSAQGMIKRTWPYLKFVLASNMGYGFYVERKDWRLRIVSTGGSVRFITADQPTINLLSGAGHHDLLIYYPLSPTHALFMEHIDNPSFVAAASMVTDNKVDELNCRLASDAYEQIYGADSGYLADLIRRI